VKASRWALGVAGVVLIGWGVHRVWVGGLATDPVAILKWLVVGLLAHDLLVAGIAAVVGTAVARVVPAPARPVVAGGLLVGAALVLVSVPLLSGRGGSGSPSADPLNYRLNLALLLAVVAAVTGLSAWRRTAAARVSTVDEDGEDDA
jgi:hypothetical protein